jgi:hypothetical protein
MALALRTRWISQGIVDNAAKGLPYPEQRSKRARVERRTVETAAPLCCNGSPVLREFIRFARRALCALCNGILDFASHDGATLKIRVAPMLRGFSLISFARRSHA